MSLTLDQILWGNDPSELECDMTQDNANDSETDDHKMIVSRDTAIHLLEKIGYDTFEAEVLVDDTILHGDTIAIDDVLYHPTDD